MNDLVFLTSAYAELKSNLFQSDLETCAVLFTKSVSKSDGIRILVNQINYPPADAYTERTSFSAQLKPEYIAPLVKLAKKYGQSIIFVHTHPGAHSTPLFSVTDDKGEERLSSFLEQRGIRGPHAALVLGPSGCSARKLGTTDMLRVIHIGHNLEIISALDNKAKHDISFDRQIRAFGKNGQSLLHDVKVGIVGLGGTGSIIVQELAYLGVQQYLLIDPDVVEETNLNRLAGATRKDVGLPKVVVGERQIKSIQPTATVAANQGSVLDISTAKLLIDTDIFFCCTDSHGSRAILNQLAYQYYIPCIDMGVSITSKDGRVTHITGRVQMLSPGLGCLTCAELLDADTVRRDLMTSFQRQADPYFIGDAQPEPAVMSLNSTVTSLAVTMFLSAITGIPAKSRYQIYNGITGSVRTVNSAKEPVCVVCSKRGALGRGDEWGVASQENFDVYRIKVLWFGLRPSDKDVEEFEHRNLKVIYFDSYASTWEKELNYTRGIIVKFDRNKPASFKKIFLAAPTAINYGVMMFAINDEASSYRIVSNIIYDLNLDEIIRPQVYTSPDIYRVAEIIARQNPGRHLEESLEIKFTDNQIPIELDNVTQFYLKRAFSDCVSIQIQQMMDGRVARGVFSVHALFKDSRVGLRPLPYFAKIDQRNKIKKEKNNYAEYAAHYIPFNLRPNLDESRCLLGFSGGILVGNFVEKSETLLVAARRGHAESAINSLYDNALRGWRLQSEAIKANLYSKMSRQEDGKVVPFIKSHKIKGDRLSLAKQFGSTAQPQDLISKLENLPEISYQQAPIHGDLHSLNVRVLNGDAILIDFSSTRLGPLLADYASLEVSLSLEVAEDDKDFEGWMDLMDTIYDLESMVKVPPTAKEPHRREWLCSCVRKIRMLALAEQKSDKEYGTLIAMHLLRQATYPGFSDEENRRKAYAFVLAERMIKKMACS